MARRKIPIVCIPDTNSLIHLRDVEIRGKDARLCLWDEFEVQISSTIQDEANRHQDLLKGQLKGKIRKSIAPITHRDSTEQAIWDPLQRTFQNTEADLGERDNVLLAFQLIVQGKARQVIFLTDELKITRRHLGGPSGFIRHLFDTYPLGLVWNSLDFLAYMYLRHKQFPLEKAENAIRTVNARIGGKQEETIKRLTHYIRSVKGLEKTRSRIPNLW